MKVIGLTGGIASGKSAVARILARLGVPVVDADQLARRVVAPGRPALGEIRRRWPEAIHPDGTLDRERLGARVFAAGDELRELTALVMPDLLAEFERELATLRAAGEPVAVFEAATLFEEDLDRLTCGVLLVSAPPEAQLRRLMARGGATEAQARQRMAAQLPLEAKLARARWVLDNAGPEDGLEPKVREVWARVLREAFGPC